MTRRLFALLIPLALAGCATASRQSADEGLRARMYATQSGLRLALSEPAHVAIFEVVPGERVSLFYPAVEGEPTRIAAGRTTLHAIGPRYRRWHLASRLGPAQPLLYMIASRHPLDETLLHDMQHGLRTRVTDRFRSNDTEETMEFLASVLVPEQAEEDWATDVLSLYSYSMQGATRTADAGEGGTVCPATGQRMGPDEHICPRPVRTSQRRPPPPPRPATP